ncbi:MAG TPA: choice-of-anchor D domain-containing protein [Terriglobales bacterium]|nr:choice-of-anchor D domain-containing protein [Terriglobales bacterium]
MRLLPRLITLLAVVFLVTGFISAQVKITTTSLPNGTVGTPYSATVNTKSGAVPFVWAVSAGSLPPGIGMTPSGDTRSALLSGTPATAGSYSFGITVQGKGGHRSTANYKVNIAGAPAGTLSASPSSLAFGSVQVGNTASLYETLTNSGGSPVTISQANVSGSEFSVSGLTLPVTLSPAQSVTFSATFTPAGAGAASGTLAIISDGSNSPLNIALSATGTSPGVLSVSPAPLNFGNVTVGSSASLAGSLTASGSAVTISSAGTDNSQYVLSGISLPLTLQPGQSAPFAVTFTPSSTGTTTSTLTFVSNASNSPTTQSLAGTGQAPVPHSVGLSWDASSGAVSYNLYRKLITDSNYTKIGSTAGGTTYTDSGIVGGQTYDYVVTSVDEQQQESAYSNIAQVTIPGS